MYFAVHVVWFHVWTIQRYTAHALSTTTSRYQGYAEFASQELAPLARAAILEHWRKPTNVTTKYEEDRSEAQTASPVTIADRNAELAMRKCIEERFPAHGIIGEEFGAVRLDAEYCWVLDPIDGTKSFITGKPTFGTLIGLCHEGVPVVGVVDHAALNEQWVGIVEDNGDGGKQQGMTTLNGTPVRAEQGVNTIQEGIMYATSPHMFRSGFETERFEAVREACQMTLYGTDCYGYALVASGFGAHLVVEADLGIYDYVALVPVLKGAGGCISDWKGRELALQNDSCCGRVVASANSALHEQALELLDGD